MLKRKRGDELEAEYKRQMTNLNRTFLQWVTNSRKANSFATCEEGCKDYVAHAQLLKGKFCTDGTIMTMGTGDCGQLGLGVDCETEEITFITRPRVIDSLKNRPIAAVACGGMHNAAVCGDDGSVWTWGCSDDDSLGRDGDENFPAPVTALGSKVHALSVSAGDCHTAVLTLGGQVFIWGTYKDKDGKNWFPATTGEEACRRSQKTPFLVEEVSDVRKHGGATQIASGSGHTLALCGDGTVFSWGIGECGQLGRKVCALKDDEGVYRKDEVLRDHLTAGVMRYASNSTPVNNARYVSAGNHHSFVLQALRSRVFGCGLNQYGQLALPESTNTELLQQVTALDSFGISSIHGAEHSSLAVTFDGDVYTFGRSDNNQLGVPLKGMNAEDAGAFTREPQLVKFNPPAKIESASCGSFHCAAIADDGSLFTWGYGEMAQLGHGEPEDEKTPRKVMNKGAPLKAVAVSSGAQHTMVIALP